MTKAAEKITRFSASGQTFNVGDYAFFRDWGVGKIINIVPNRKALPNTLPASIVHPIGKILPAKRLAFGGNILELGQGTTQDNALDLLNISAGNKQTGQSLEVAIDFLNTEIGYKKVVLDTASNQCIPIFSDNEIDRFMGPEVSISYEDETDGKLRKTPAVLCDSNKLEEIILAGQRAASDGELEVYVKSLRILASIWAYRNRRVRGTKLKLMPFSQASEYVDALFPDCRIENAPDEHLQKSQKGRIDFLRSIFNAIASNLKHDENLAAECMINFYEQGILAEDKFKSCYLVLSHVFADQFDAENTGNFLTEKGFPTPTDEDELTKEVTEAAFEVWETAVENLEHEGAVELTDFFSEIFSSPD